VAFSRKGRVNESGTAECLQTLCLLGDKAFFVFLGRECMMNRNKCGKIVIFQYN